MSHLLDNLSSAYKIYIYYKINIWKLTKVQEKYSIINFLFILKHIFSIFILKFFICTYIQTKIKSLCSMVDRVSSEI